MEFVIIKQLKNSASEQTLSSEEVNGYLTKNRPGIVFYNGIEPVNGNELMSGDANLQKDFRLRVTIYKTSIKLPFFRKEVLQKANA